MLNKIDLFCDKNPEFIFIIGVGLALIISLYFIINLFRAKKRDKFDGVDYIFYMHGKALTQDEAKEYYEVQKSGGIDPYLMIYSTKNNRYVFMGDYSYYFKEYVTPIDYEE